MKKIIFWFFFSLLAVYLFASLCTFSSDCKTVLELNGSTTNDGSGSQTYTISSNWNSSYYFTGICSGITQSFGLINGNNEYGISAALDSTPYRTIQLSVLVVSSGQPVNSELFEDSYMEFRLYFYSGTLYYDDSQNNRQVSIAFSRDAWHTIDLCYDTGSSGECLIYVDSSLKATDTNVHLPGNIATYYEWGQYYNAYTSGNYSNAYYNSIIFSTTNYAGVEITPVVPSPTFTFTNTPTWSPTFTNSPTYTNTPVYTPTWTPTQPDILATLQQIGTETAWTATPNQTQAADETNIAILQANQTACGCFYAVESLTPTFSMTPTFTLTVTQTYNATQIWVISSYTPTPGVPPMICNTPWQVNSFVQNQTPVLVPTTTFEGGSAGSVVEPNVIVGPDGLLHMTYTGNAFYLNGGVETICLATSSDGINWTRYGSIIGGGALGEPNACGQSSQLHIGSEYRIYFSDELHKMVYYATSVDGYNYTLVGYPLNPVFQISYFQPPCTGSGGESDGIGIFLGSDGKYHGIAEIIANQCPGPYNYPYALWLMDDTSGNATQFYPASQETLVGLVMYNGSYIPLTSGRITQGGRATMEYNGIYYTFYGLGMNTNLYMAESNDLFNWYVFDVNPLVSWTQHMFGLNDNNQAVDASICEYNGQTYLFYDGTDNANGPYGVYPGGAIGYSVYNGTFAQFASCGILTPTPTGTPTATPTFTITPNLTLTAIVNQTSTAIINAQLTAIAGFTQTEIVILSQTPTPNLSFTMTPTSVGSAYVVGSTWTPTKTPEPTKTNTPVFTPTIYITPTPNASRTPYIIPGMIKNKRILT
jgi:hypothetical protein